MLKTVTLAILNADKLIQQLLRIWMPEKTGCFYINPRFPVYIVAQNGKRKYK